MPADSFHNARKVSGENNTLKTHRNNADDCNDNDKKLINKNIDRSAVMISVYDEMIHKEMREQAVLKTLGDDFDYISLEVMVLIFSLYNLLSFHLLF